MFKIYHTGRLKVVALRGLYMSVRKAEMVAVMGPSGSGKTTLINLLAGIDKPTAGYLRVFGVELHKADERTLEEHRLHRVGVIFQFFNLIPSLTALENVELPMVLAGRPMMQRRQRALELLRMVGLEHRKHHRPDELSGGEQQRVAIACALANDPPLILADEPTGELDWESGSKVVELLRRAVNEAGKTVIVATHDPRIARVADRILRIEDGKITREYRPTELVEAPRTPKEETVVTYLRRRLVEAEEELHRLERAHREGRISGKEFHGKYQRLLNLIEALTDELQRLGYTA